MATTTFEIAQREPVLGGRPFGDAGAYEKIAGTLRFAVDPRHPHHADITDLDRAPRNATELVEFSADFYLLRPVEAARGNGALLLDVPNRGRKLAPQLFDDSPQPGANRAEAPEDAGIGFLHRQGFTMVWVGWQGDIPSKPGQMALTPIPCWPSSARRHSLSILTPALDTQ